MIQLIRTKSDNQDFIDLVYLLDEYLAEKDGKEHSFYAQFNTIDALRQVVVAYLDKEPVACGALKEIDKDRMEIKRMFTKKAQRGKGIASQVLEELEKWAQELNYPTCVLETGKRQLEAVQFYLKNEYQVTPNYGQYMGIKNSICFQKNLTSKSFNANRFSEK